MASRSRIAISSDDFVPQSRAPPRGTPTRLSSDRRSRGQNSSTRALPHIATPGTPHGRARPAVSRPRHPFRRARRQAPSRRGSMRAALGPAPLASRRPSRPPQQPKARSALSDGSTTGMARTPSPTQPPVTPTKATPRNGAMHGNLSALQVPFHGEPRVLPVASHDPSLHRRLAAQLEAAGHSGTAAPPAPACHGDGRENRPTGTVPEGIAPSRAQLRIAAALSRRHRTTGRLCDLS
jgi:hypothetical protein